MPRARPLTWTPNPRYGVLTRRQREVVRLLAQGYKPAAVARRLGVCQAAVDGQIQRIHERLGLAPDPERTRATQIVIEAVRRGELKGD